MTARRTAVLCALSGCGLFGGKGKSTAETKIPQEEIDRKNPITSNSASSAEGKRHYGATDCALCDGKEGDSKGVFPKDISMNLHDRKKPEPLALFTDGEQSYLVLMGKRRMAAYDGRQPLTMPASGALPNPR